MQGQGSPQKTQKKHQKSRARRTIGKRNLAASANKRGKSERKNKKKNLGPGCGPHTPQQQPRGKGKKRGTQNTKNSK